MQHDEKRPVVSLRVPLELSISVDGFVRTSGNRTYYAVDIRFDYDRGGYVPATAFMEAVRETRHGETLKSRKRGDGNQPMFDIRVERDDDEKVSEMEITIRSRDGSIRHKENIDFEIVEGIVANIKFATLAGSSYEVDPDPLQLKNAKQRAA